MTAMRAKLRVTYIQKWDGGETLHFAAVCKNQYDSDGLDEDNTYATFTPAADLTIAVTNPNLLNKFKEGEAYYVDFTLTEKPNAELGGETS